MRFFTYYADLLVDLPGDDGNYTVINSSSVGLGLQTILIYYLIIQLDIVRSRYTNDLVVLLYSNEINSYFGA